LHKTSPSVGRPKSKPLTQKHLTNSRVRSLIDAAHQGNVLDASRVTGLPYATVRDLYRGRTTNPSLKTLRILAKVYGVPLAWLTDDQSPAAVPTIVGYLAAPADSAGPAPVAEFARVRRVRISLAAWSLYRIFRVLLEYLRSLPATPNRPVVGDAREDRELVRRLTEFLLQPLLIAEQAGQTDVIYLSLGAGGEAASEHEALWITRLQQVGNLWEVLLPDLLATARALERAEQGRSGP